MLKNKKINSDSESQGLSTAGIEHIAKLARIELSDKEKKGFKKELSSILNYINKLNELDTESVDPALAIKDGVEPLYQTTGIVNALRSDEHRNDFEMNGGLNEKLIGQAPDTNNRFVKVRSVLKK